MTRPPSVLHAAQVSTVKASLHNYVLPANAGPCPSAYLASVVLGQLAQAVRDAAAALVPSLLLALQQGLVHPLHLASCTRCDTQPRGRSD